MLRRFFPFLEWFESYNKQKLWADLIAGLTVALVLIPQSVAYAKLAGLPPYYGLYAAFLPPMVAALFGSSRQLATGPVAVVSLMTAATLEPLATAGGEAYVAYAILLALLVGAFQFALGVFRLGVVVNFLSHPVVIGFTNAAAIIIATSQLGEMFGVSVDKAEHHYETVWRVIAAALHYRHWPTLSLGVLALAVMVILKRINPRLPYVLAAVALTTLLSWGFGFERNRTTMASAIESPEVQDLLRQFNERTGEIASTSNARTLLNPKVEKIEAAHGKICTSCHAARHIDVTAPPAEPSAPLPPEKALELHLKAGLIGQHLTELNEEASQIRTRLRGMLFEAVDEGQGRLRFYPEGNVPAGKSSDGRLWRIKIGNTPIDFDKIQMVGSGAVVGQIPEGLPKLAVPKFDMSVLGKLFLSAIIISILGFMEAISIAKAMAARTGQRLDPNQELIGQGLANMLGSFGQSYAVSGSFSRSAVNIQAGAVTGMASVFTSGMVVLTLLFFTPLLYHLPQSVLAAVIMMAVIGLINVKGVVHAWRVKRSDGVIAVISFAATLFFAPHLDRGILLGVALSVGMFLYRKMKPAIAELSLWHDGHLRNANRLRLKQCKHIAVIRFDGPLFFANTSYLEDEILERVRAMPELKYILFKSNGITELDASGEEQLALIIDRLRSGGYDIAFTGLNERVIDTLHRSHLYEHIGEDHIFHSAAEALAMFWNKAHQGSDEKDCPLQKVVPLEAPASEYRLKVLLVDDETEYVEHLSKRLIRRGLDVQGAPDGVTALAILARQSFDVVVLDVLMPGMSGLEVLKAIKNATPELAVILLSGHASMENAIEGMKLGADDYLQKPCDIEDLAAKIRHAHENRM
ncbi:MAG: response regulator [Myxococcales bacterium]|nr:MAG: response regulator [Myxococcales bacterium]